MKLINQSKIDCLFFFIHYIHIFQTSKEVLLLILNNIFLDFSNIKIMSKVQKQRVQTFGRKKTATAVAVCQQGKDKEFFY